MIPLVTYLIYLFGKTIYKKLIEVVEILEKNQKKCFFMRFIKNSKSGNQ